MRRPFLKYFSVNLLCNPRKSLNLLSTAMLFVLNIGRFVWVTIRYATYELMPSPTFVLSDIDIVIKPLINSICLKGFLLVMFGTCTKCLISSATVEVSFSFKSISSSNPLEISFFLGTCYIFNKN